ncbi:PEP-CTERM sorting domain-containing protein [Desertibaculum subflavum]|uniref:PEP-CTERM sorting domain-containing protein n=1 Tax=Desertibaculum subflavum TaxID=2268458 RepID=UPI000E666094
MPRFTMLATLAVAWLFIGLSSAQAGVVFNMTGVCTSAFCGSTGQNPGDPISGFVEFENFDAAPNGSFLVPTNYHLEFGNVVLTTAITSYFLKGGHDTFQKIDDQHIGPGDFKVWGNPINLAIIFVGNCFGCAANDWAYGFSPGSFGTFEFTREGSSEVVEPASMALLGVALLAFAAWRRRPGP